MGGTGSKGESQQILLLGLSGSGKSLFLKKLLELKKEIRENLIESTVGYNFVSLEYFYNKFHIWDLGGDSITRSYWSTFYRNLRFNIVIYFINLYDDSSYMTMMKELIILLNEEELKQARFFILFNIKPDENKKLISNDETTQREQREKIEVILADLRECPIHEYETRVKWGSIDVSKMKDGENNTVELLAKCLFGNNNKSDE